MLGPGNAQLSPTVDVSAPISVEVRAGASSFVALPGSINSIATGLGDAQFAVLAQFMADVHGRLPSPKDDVPSLDPLEQHLDKRIDRLRDASVDGDPDEYIRLFEDELSNLPAGIGGTIRFRLKANIGHRHFAKGDLIEASRWLLAAFDDAPDDPRAISNKVIGLWAAGDPEEAYRYGAGMLALDPTNEVLASYMPQVAAVLPSVEDPLEHVPTELRHIEPVVAAHAIFLRQRDRMPEWWTFARSGHARFPESDHLELLVAFSEVDEVGRSIADAGHPDPNEDQRRRLAVAAPILDEYWRRRSNVLKSRFNDGPYALAAAMIAYQLLANGGKALELASEILKHQIDHPQLIVQAIQVALSNADMDLAQALTIDLAEDPDVAYQIGIIGVNIGEWEEAAAAFRRANVPVGDRAMVATFLRLVDIGEDEPSCEKFTDILAECADDIRGLVLMSHVAQRTKRLDVAQDAYRRAKDLVHRETTQAGRFMVASLARDIGTPADLIVLLDGHLRTGTDEREWNWLAQAHAMESPHRRRNLGFFERLDSSMLALPGIARAQASVLFDTGDHVTARPIFERLRLLRPDDTFVTLRLLQIYHLLEDQTAAAELLAGATVDPDGYAPENEMVLAAQIAFGGDPVRGYASAYAVFRAHPNRGDLAMGYVSLDLSGRVGGTVFGATTADRDACVVVRSSSGASRTIVIDDGHGFFGLDVEAPDGPMARQVLGKVVGETFRTPRMTGDDEVWTIEAIHSKYLELHRQIFAQFEARFPGAPGLATVTLDDDLTNVFDVVRRRGESTSRIAQDYLRLGIPIAIAASFDGGNPVAFADYLRSIDASVATSTGRSDESERSRELAVRQFGAGLSLDPYTVWTAAQLHVLPALKATYGTLSIPGSALDVVDAMLAKEREAIGTEQMSMAWHAGEFLKVVHTDDERLSRIGYIERLRNAIEMNCAVRSVVLPDELDEELASIHLRSGTDLLDAGLLARESEALLVSEDMHYRRLVAHAGIVADGIWLQPALEGAYVCGHLSEAEYAQAVAGLALRRHGHVNLTARVLYLICLQDGEGIPGFRASVRFIANPAAEMISHYGVITDFLRLAWSRSSELSFLRRQSATGALLDSMIMGGRTDGLAWLEHLVRWFRGNSFLAHYIQGWFRGHFISSNGSGAKTENHRNRLKRQVRRRNGRRRPSQS